MPLLASVEYNITSFAEGEAKNARETLAPDLAIQAWRKPAGWELNGYFFIRYSPEKDRANITLNWTQTKRKGNKASKPSGAVSGAAKGCRLPATEQMNLTTLLAPLRLSAWDFRETTSSGKVSDNGGSRKYVTHKVSYNREICFFTTTKSRMNYEVFGWYRRCPFMSKKRQIYFSEAASF